MKNVHFKLQTLNLIINNKLVKYLFIFESEELKPHIFSDFFIDNIEGFTLINKAYNTQKNFYGEYVVKFLNYIFNESHRKVDDITLVDVKLVEEFLNKYSQRKLNADTKEEWRSAESVAKMNRALKIFIYWLCIKKEKNQILFEMKYISENNFKKKIIYVKNRYGNKKLTVLEDIFSYKTSNSQNSRDKVTGASKYTIFKLLELAEIKDPMLTFGIVLGAFSGLRAGETMQVNQNILRGFEDDDTGCFIDLREERILRSDGKITGHIKTKGKQIIYEGFARIVKIYYKRHMELLKRKGFNNKYGALFINNRGEAMLDKNYLVRFKKLIELYTINVLTDAMNGEKNMIKEKTILDEGPITPHSLRHFYSNYLDELEDGNRFTIKLYRRDSSEKSQDDYVIGGVTEKMRLIQESVIEEIFKYGDEIL